MYIFSLHARRHAIHEYLRLLIITTPLFTFGYEYQFILKARQIKVEPNKNNARFVNSVDGSWEKMVS